MNRKLPQPVRPPAWLGLAIILAAGPAPTGWCAPEPDYVSPESIVAATNVGKVYAAEATADRIAVVDLATRAVVRRIAVPARPSGLALSPDGLRLYATCAAPESRVVVIDTASDEVLRNMPAGHSATGPARSPDGKRLAVCNRFDGTVEVFDPEKGLSLAVIPVGREPISSAFLPDGKTLLVAHHLHEGRSDADYVASPVSVVDTAEGKLVKKLRMPNGTTLIRDIRCSPDGRHAVAVHTLARYQLPTTQLDRGWMNTSAATVIDLARLEVLNTFLLDDVDLGAANPWGVAWSADGRILCIAHAGTHEASLIDFPGVLAKIEKAKAADIPNDLAFLVDLRRRVPLAGVGSRGAAVAGGELWVANYFSQTLSVVPLAGAQPKAASVPLASGSAKADPVRQGERWFNDATICFQQWQSCASCHSDDARIDALNWDLLNDGIGNPKNNKSMLYTHRTPPVMSLGVREDAKVAVRAGIRFIQFTVQPPEVADAMDAYLMALKPVPSPLLEGGKLSKSAQAGEKLFAAQGCAECHPAPLYTDLKQYDLGQGKGQDEGKPVDTPSLVEAWRTAPYLHDGRAATLKELFLEHRHGLQRPLGDDELQALIDYVSSL